MTWRDLLPRIRLVDLGPGATFGQRHVAKVEGIEVCRSRPSDGGPPATHLAAALLRLLGVTPDTPTWEIRDRLQTAGLGPPYGRQGVDSAVRNLLDRARSIASETT